MGILVVRIMKTSTLANSAVFYCREMERYLQKGEMRAARTSWEIIGERLDAIELMTSKKSKDLELVRETQHKEE